MTLLDLGWNPSFEKAWSEADRAGHSPARVVEEHKNSWRLAGEQGQFLAQIAGRLRHRAMRAADMPAVGDWVETGDGVIYEVLPRQSQFSRKAAGKRVDAQIVAANIDTVFIVSSLNRDHNPRRLERYLTLVWESGAMPVIVLNKADLCEDTASAINDTEAVAPGVSVFALSARLHVGLEQLSSFISCGKTIALVGSSGVGKSTLVNLLIGADRQAVLDIRDDDRGRHATTTRTLVVLPSGGLLIDTPGMRELHLWSTGEGLDRSFSEIEELSSQCRFRDCRHEDEPGCAVLQAVEDGELPRERYESFLKLRKEVAYLERKQDVSAQLELKRKWKEIHKAHRAKQKIDKNF
jgi:ribosome biogenesis GTPase